MLTVASSLTFSCETMGDLIINNNLQERVWNLDTFKSHIIIVTDRFSVMTFELITRLRVSLRRPRHSAF